MNQEQELKIGCKDLLLFRGFCRVREDFPPSLFSLLCLSTDMAIVEKIDLLRCFVFLKGLRKYLSKCLFLNSLGVTVKR